MGFLTQEPSLLNLGLVPTNLFSRPELFSEERSTYERLREYLADVVPQLPEQYQSRFRKQCQVVKEGWIADEIYDNLNSNPDGKWHNNNSTQLIVYTAVPRQIVKEHSFIYLAMLEVTFTYNHEKVAREVCLAFGRKFRVMTGEENAPFIIIKKRGRFSEKWVVCAEGHRALEEIMGK